MSLRYCMEWHIIRFGMVVRVGLSCRPSEAVVRTRASALAASVNLLQQHVAEDGVQPTTVLFLSRLSSSMVRICTVSTAMTPAGPVRIGNRPIASCWCRSQFTILESSCSCLHGCTYRSHGYSTFCIMLLKIRSVWRSLSRRTLSTLMRASVALTCMVEPLHHHEIICREFALLKGQRSIGARGQDAAVLLFMHAVIESSKLVQGYIYFFMHNLR